MRSYIDAGEDNCRGGSKNMEFSDSEEENAAV